MSETYRKWGRTVRFENGAIVRVEEAGEAVEDGEEFSARPLRERRDLPEVASPHPPFGHLLPLTREKGAGAYAVPLAVAGEGGPERAERVERSESPAIERVVLTEGVSLHQYGNTVWSERTRRLHVSIARHSFRMLVDQREFAIDPELLDQFSRLEGRREPPRRLTLAPRVTAAILSSLIGRLDLAQRAGETPDGKGRAVESCPLTGGEPPNWYRPSYRVRPVRAWFNLLALPFGRLEDAVPRAVALLGERDVLCVDGGKAFATVLSVGRVLAVGGAEAWYPYGAGAWGSDMLLESGR